MCLPISALFPYTTLFRSLGGGLKPIDEEWSTFEDAEQFPDSVQHTIDGTLYAVQGYVNLLGLWCNVDQLTELGRSEEHTSELQSRGHLVCRLLLEKKNKC